MRRTKAQRDDWLRRYHEAGALYTQDECGCLLFVVVDMPEEVRAASKEIARELAAGRLLKRCARPGLPPADCPTHAAERRAAS